MNGRKALMLAAPLLLALGIGAAQAQARSLDAAVRHVATEASFNVRMGATVALASVNSDTFRMSNYLANGITEALLGTGRVMLVDWSRQRDGVEYTIAADLEPHAEGFRLVARVTRVEGSIIQGTFSSVVMRNDPVLASLLGQPHAPGAAAGPARAAGFTVGQRWATYWLNWLVPGLGSFVIMGDVFGGVFQAVTGLGGNAMVVMGVMFISPGLWLPGMFMQITYAIFNIARSAAFGRNAQMAAACMKKQWELAAAPWNYRARRVELAQTLRL